MSSALASSSPHQKFSLARIWALATNTVTQLLRMKILVFLAVFTLVCIVFGFAFSSNSPDQQLKLLKDVSLGTLQVFSMVIAIAATALLLPRDLEDRTLYTILSKPVPRYEYLIGKLLGVILLLFGGMLIMDLILSSIIWLKQSLMVASQVTALGAEQNDTPENVAFVKNLINQYGLNWSLHAGVWSVFLKASVIAALTLLISCFASSTLFTIVVSLGFTIAGHGQQLMRDWFLSDLSSFWEKSLSLLLTLLCPDLGLFDLVEAAIRGEIISFHVLFNVTGIASLYVVGYTAAAYLFFSDKEL